MGVYKRLRAKLDKAGLKPSVRRGQNFLLDMNLLNFIVETAAAGPNDLVLEVGPGTGFLTRRLALTGCLVLGVELDHGLLPLAKDETKDLPNVFIMQGDILAGKNRINPDVLSKVQELHDEKSRLMREENNTTVPSLKCVSNLPYSAGTPFVMNLLSSELPWERGVFLLQREVGERMTAGPGGKDYGALAIMCGLAAKAKAERIVGPQVFWPRPKVDSVVVKMDFLPVNERSALPWRELRQVTSAVFGSRRKILKNALKGIYGDEIDVGEMLQKLGLDPGGRGEEIGPEGFLAMAGELKKVGKK